MKCLTYWEPWFNNGRWVHYGEPGSPSECMLMLFWVED